MLKKAALSSHLLLPDAFLYAAYSPALGEAVPPAEAKQGAPLDTPTAALR